MTDPLRLLWIRRVRSIGNLTAEAVDFLALGGFVVGFGRLDAAGAGGDLGDYVVVVDMGDSFHWWCRGRGEDELRKGWGEVMVGNRVDAKARVARHNPLEIGFYCEISKSSGNNLQDINRLFVWRVFGLRLSHRIHIHTYKTDRTEVSRLEEQVYSPFVQIKPVHLPLEWQGEVGYSADH